MMRTKLFFETRVSSWLTIFIYLYSSQIRVSNTGSVVVDSGHHVISGLYTSSDNSYANSDIRLVSILKTFYSSLNESTIALISSSNSTIWRPYVDQITEEQWADECDIAEEYLSLMEDMIAYNNDNNSFVTYNRLNMVLECKEDCSFEEILSVPSNFTSYSSQNTSKFALNAIMHLPAEAAFLCPYEFASLAAYEEANVSFLLQNIQFIRVVDPEHLLEFSKEESYGLAELITLSHISLTEAQILALSENIAENTPLDNISGLASGLSLSCFDATSLNKLISLLPNMDLSLMDDTKKMYISSLISKTENATLIKQLMAATTDKHIIESIPAYLFDKLSINISSFSAKHLPESYLHEYAETVLETCLSKITDLNVISKIIPAINEEHLECIKHGHMVETIERIVEASLEHDVDLHSMQRYILLEHLVETLEVLSESHEPAVYLEELTSSEIDHLYPLFIEAEEEILVGFEELETFHKLIDKVSHIPKKKCCIYSKVGLKHFAEIAIQYLFSFTRLSVADLDMLGPCLISNMPLEYLENLEPKVFVEVFVPLGHIFQPKKSEITVIRELITKYAENSTLTKSQDTLFFNKLSSLALFYPFEEMAASLHQWKTDGGPLAEKIEAYEATISSNYLCQLGLSSSDKLALQTLIHEYDTLLIEKIEEEETHKKRKIISRSEAAVVASTSSFNFTCEILKELGRGVVALTSAELATISVTEFKKCELILGHIHHWSTAQLTTLAALAIKAFGSAALLTDHHIESLNAICQGFTSAQLRTLTFKTIDSIHTLGSLKKWTSSQLTALATPLGTYIKTYLNYNITSTFLAASGNLLCSISSTYIATKYITSKNFLLSMGSLSKVNTPCPNMASWYSFAKQNTRYIVSDTESHSSTSETTSGHKKRFARRKRSAAAATTDTAHSETTTTAHETPAITANSLTELGTVIAGITAADMATLPASFMSFISSSALQYMPAATINALTTDQLNGLSSEQVAYLVNSPYYSSFKSSIKTGLAAIASNQKAHSSSRILKACFRLILISTSLVLFLFI